MQLGVTLKPKCVFKYGSQEFHDSRPQGMGAVSLAMHNVMCSNMHNGFLLKFYHVPKPIYVSFL